MRRHADLIFQAVAFSTLLIALAALVALLVDVITDGAARLDLAFLTNIASRRPEDAGVFHALAGSIWVVTLTAALALPIGVAHLGAPQYFWLHFFGDQAPEASLLAFSLAAHVTFMVMNATLGLPFLPRATRELT